MSWSRIPINKEDIEQSYAGKYGIHSAYQSDQKSIYANPVIQGNLKTAVSWIELKPAMTILDIGMNNGYEFGILKKFFEGKWNGLNIIGIDLIEDVLKQAAEISDAENQYAFIYGDVSDFSGRNIQTGKIEDIKDNSIDVVFAFTSLQSTSLAEEIDVFLTKLLAKLKLDSQILIGTPNFHFDDSNNISSGTFDALSGRADVQFAKNFSEKVTSFFTRHGFESKRVGETIIFDYFRKTA